MSDPQWDITGRPIEGEARSVTPAPQLDPVERIARDVAVIRGVMVLWLIITVAGIVAAVIVATM